MKRKICLATLVLSSSLMLLLAGKDDPCTVKYNACVDSCMNALSQCKAAGRDPGLCADHFNVCKADCEKAKKTCESKKK